MFLDTQSQVTSLASGFRITPPRRFKTYCFLTSPDVARPNALETRERSLKLVRPPRNRDFSSSDVVSLYFLRIVSKSFVERANAVTSADFMSGSMLS